MVKARVSVPRLTIVLSDGLYMTVASRIFFASMSGFNPSRESAFGVEQMW